MATYTNHSAKQQRVLQKAGLSMRTELKRDEKVRLIAMAKEHGNNLKAVSGQALRYYIMPTQRPDHQSVSAAPDTSTGEVDTRPRKPGKVKREPTDEEVAELAKARREGSTWSQLDELAGRHRSSTDYRILFEKHGFDKLGRQFGSNQESKAVAVGMKKKAKRRGRIRKRKSRAA